MFQAELKAIERLQVLSRRWKAERPGVPSSMREALDAFRRIRARGPWASLGKLDWGAGREAFACWLHEELNAYPLPPGVKGLWFSAPEMEFESPQTWVIGSRTFSIGTDNFDWAAREVWPPEAAHERARQGRGAPIAVMLEPLREARGVLGLSGPELDSDSLDRRQFFLYILPLAFTSALLVDVLPLIWPRLLLGRAKRRGIACSFQSGDGVSLGWLTPSGWHG